MTRQFSSDASIRTSGGVMKKLLSIMVGLSAIVLVQCTEENKAIDPTTLFTLTSGFSSSYMTFQITDGVATVPEYQTLNSTSGLVPDPANYGGLFTHVTASEINMVGIILPSLTPTVGSEYLEDSPNLFTYTRGATAYTINTAYSGGNDFRVTITKWPGTGKYMEATFSGVVCNGGSSDCLTIESGFIKALIK
jgi:hypothetical protein